MVDRNGIIKPSLLGNVLENEASTSNSSASAENSIDLNMLAQIITRIVRAENQSILAQISPPSLATNSNSDQSIEAQYQQNLDDMDRIPDVVKSLREFSGEAGEFGSWKKSVERILKIYNHLKGTPKYYGILSVIRNKIKGRADIALESYNTPLNWDAISRCLTLHYADKRDLGTLEYQMTTLVQKNTSITEFYHEVYYHLSLILNKLSSMDLTQESLDVMTQAYRDKALDTFVRGLKGDLPKLLSMREPHDLPQALHLCLKLENVQYRVQHSHGNIRTSNFSRSPPLPPRQPVVAQQRGANSFSRANFHPELLHNPQTFQGFHRPQQYGPIHNPHHFSKPDQYLQKQSQMNPKNHNHFPKPEPMEVDRSIHSRAVNYQNRVQLNAQQVKRPQSNQIHQPAKFQRIFHTEQSLEDDQCEPPLEDPDPQQYQEASTSYDEQYDQSLEEYSNPQHEILDDINFLD